MGQKTLLPVVLAVFGIPIGIAPSGTMGANGAVTLDTALDTTYAGGLWLYYPAGAVYAGSAAGFYWTVMSSTTLGTVYNNIYVPTSRNESPPAAPTGVVDAGPGAFTGVTGAITAVSVTVPGGIMGRFGWMEQSVKTQQNNSAGTKTLTTKLGGTDCGVNTAPSTQVTYQMVMTLQNIGAANRQRYVANTTDDAALGTAAATYPTIDTSINQEWTFVINKNTATDWCLLQGARLVVYPSAAS